ncbi:MULTISPECIES: hypothetical protein [unclassified Aureimonas]|uniref:hypothetical protein n=1 Tax=unclassified Aureimonas TaxID=2615206 RepID=UPI00071F6A1B|nr:MULTISPECIES: hypothetical protein [unclassified Aureimonas]ALN71412.1 hypothetical protein M673_01735 [Aureimonas sp. AU20]
MSSRTLRILHRPPSVWELDQDAEGHRAHRISAYREVLRVFVHPRRAKLEAPEAMRREGQGEPAVMA